MRCGEMQNGEKIPILTRRFHFSQLRPVGGAKTLPPSVERAEQSENQAETNLDLGLIKPIPNRIFLPKFYQNSKFYKKSKNLDF